MTTAFSLAFLIPLLIATTISSAASRGVVLLGAALCLASVRQRPRTASALAAGLLLFCGQRDASAPALPLAPRAALVSVRGVVNGPARSGPRGCFLPVRGVPSIALPAGVDAPLPGSIIRASGRLEPSGRVIRVPAGDHVSVVTPPPWWHPGAATERARRGLRRRLAVGMGSHASDVLRALLLGDPLPREDRERLARTGTLHFFAVSGLHLSLVAAMVAHVVGQRGRWLLPPLVCYAALSGLRTPVSRALLMAGGVFGARAHRRPFRPFPHLLLAATIVTSLDRSAFTSAGFLLSFSAYAGIIGLALPALVRRRRDPLRALEIGLGATGPWRERCLATLVVATAAFACSAPATASLFHRLSPVAVIASLLLAPLIPLLLASALVLIAFPGCRLGVLATEGLLAALEGFIVLLDRLPLGAVDVPRPHPLALSVFVVACGIAASRVHRGKTPIRTILALAGATAILAIPTTPPPPGASLLPAGQGTALLLTIGARTTLVDAGPEKADIASALLRAGIRTLDHLVISHEHADHAGGRAGLLQRLAVINEGPAVPEAEVLWPPPHPPRDLGLNDLSLVLRFDEGHARTLVMGDLETIGLRGLLERPDALDADVLVLPHHGARNDALADLILRTGPDACWLPAREGFPSETTMLTLAWLGAEVRPTWSEIRPPRRLAPRAR